MIERPETRKGSLELLVVSFLLFIPHYAFAQGPEPARPEMKWFQDSKLGIFIHWGIYSVNGVDESWAFYNKKMAHEDYMQQLGGFTASKYDPAAWADLIQRSGAKYAVITTKHHDGVAMWPTAYGHTIQGQEHLVALN
ncbi:MAG: alpha-L-fucosidase, partial [Flavobacteriales bacterium]|nr:alpha-L-fucosidase [Flavobacteriales bacterium]